MQDQRHLWADLAKGLSIILVVYGHATVGVVKDVPMEGWLFDTLMKPISQFRMPLFFFVAGIFAHFSIRREWPRFIDRTILHLVYVFVVWNLLQYGARMAFAAYANTPIEPFRILFFWIHPINITWFIWALIVFYLICRAWRSLPLAPLVAVAAVLAAAPIEGLTYAIQQGSAFFLYFVLGLALSDQMRAFDREVRGVWVLSAIVAYTVAALIVVHLGLLAVPVIELATRLAGIAMVLTVCMWLAQNGRCGWLAVLGRHTLPIFVTHTLVTAGLREIVLRTGMSDGALVLILVAWAGGVVLPLMFDRIMRRLGLPWLFERPAWFSLASVDRAGAVLRRPAASAAGRA
ncbi:MAG: acyltransferase family protein [Geminicoccaceae bacterium]|nr:acyltransferase family protein [Geminicoccaceae bacterium]